VHGYCEQLVIQQEDSERNPERNRVDATELDSIVDRTCGKETCLSGISPVQSSVVLAFAIKGLKRVALFLHDKGLLTPLLDGAFRKAFSRLQGGLLENMENGVAA
jgi:hypothetical protein